MSTGDTQVADNQARAAALGVNIPGVGGGNGVPVITAAGLQSNPTPLTVPAMPPTTAPAALGGALSSTQRTWQQQLDAAAAGAKDNSDKSLSDVLAAELSGGTAEFTDQAYKAAGVDKAQQELTDTNNQIVAEEEALNHKVDALKTNTQGLFGTGLQQEIDKATSASLSKRADLAVIQLSKQGAFDSAKAIADRAVAAKMEARQNQITVLDQIYQANKDIFTTAEQHQFEAAQAERQSKLAIDTHNEETRFDELIKQSDPLYQAQLASALNASTGVYTAGANPAVDGWIKQINAGAAKISDVPAALKSIVIQGLSGDDQKSSQLKTDAATSAQQLLARLSSGGSGFGVGVGSVLPVIPGSKTADFVRNLDNLKSLLSLDNVKYLKGQGQISDAERKLLADSATQLDRTQSPDQFRQTLTSIVTALNGANAGAPDSGSQSYNTASGKSFDYAAAKQAGYSDEEIQAYLASH